MGEIRTNDTWVSILASSAYILPFITLVFGPLLLYFEFRKKSSFIAFHAIYALGVALLAGIAIVLPTQIGLPILIIAGLLWLYGIAACAFGTTPIILRKEIARIAGADSKH